MKTQKRKKQAGFIVSAELMLIATILVIGMIVGLVAIRDAVNAELNDTAEALGAMDQSYYFDGIMDPGTLAMIGASAYSDQVDNVVGIGWPSSSGQAGDQTPLNFSVANEGLETNPQPAPGP